MDDFSEKPFSFFKRGAVSFLLFIICFGTLQAERLRVGIYDNPPKVFIDENGEPSGFFVDIMNEIAEKKGWQIQYCYGTWSEGLSRLTSGEIDLMTDVAYTEKRAEKWRYHSVPVLSDWFQVFVHEGSDIYSVVDLSGKKVAVLAQSVQEEAFSKHVKEFGFQCELIPFESYTESFRMLHRKQVDAVIVNRFYGMEYLDDFDIRETAIIFHPTRLHFAASFRVDPAVLEAIDEELKKMSSDTDSFYFKAVSRWFGEMNQTVVPSWVWVLILLLSVVGILTMSAAYILKKEVRKRTEHIIQVNESLQNEIEVRKESENKFNELFENSPVAYFIITPEKGHIESLNTAANALLGYSGDDIRGLVFNALFPDTPGGKPCARAVFDEFMRDKKTMNREVQMVRKDGEMIWANLSITGVYDTGHNLTEVRAMAIDISDRKVLEEQLIRTQKMEALGLLAGGIAHDFNNILTAIIGYTEVVMEKTKTNKLIYDKLEEVYKAGMHARNLVKQILTFSRKTKYELQPIEMKSVVREALKLLKASLSRSVTISTEISASSWVLADPTQLHQIVMNMCINAGQSLKDEKGDILIRLDEIRFDQEKMAEFGNVLNPGDYVRLRIKDTGEGISVEDLPHIFEPFYTTKAPGKGTGMGLPMVLHIVKTLQGGIDVQSGISRGSEFTVYLPVYEIMEDEQHKDDEYFSQGKESILLVEDNEPVIELIKQNLEESGYHVTAMRDALEALDYLKVNSGSIDLVISNLTMPKINGAKLADEIKAAKIEIPFLIITGHGEDVLDKIRKNTKIAGVIQKPFTKAELIRKIRSVLQRDQ